VKAAISGRCAGQEFDEALVTEVKAQFLRKNPGIPFEELEKDARPMRRLQIECERVKEQLSFAQSEVVVMDSLYARKDFDFPVSRAQFEQLNESSFNATPCFFLQKIHMLSGICKTKVNYY